MAFGNSRREIKQTSSTYIQINNFLEYLGIFPVLIQFFLQIVKNHPKNVVCSSQVRETCMVLCTTSNFQWRFDVLDSYSLLLILNESVKAKSGRVFMANKIIG